MSLEQEGPGNCDDGKGDNEHFDDKTSVLFDAVAIILSDEGAKTLSVESAAIDFVRDAFGHLKTIAVDKGGQALLKTANVGQDAGVVDTNDKDAFIAVAKTRQWDREKSARTSASWHNRQSRRAGSTRISIGCKLSVLAYRPVYPTRGRRALIAGVGQL